MAPLHTPDPVFFDNVREGARCGTPLSGKRLIPTTPGRTAVSVVLDYVWHTACCTIMPG